MTTRGTCARVCKCRTFARVRVCTLCTCARVGMCTCARVCVWTCARVCVFSFVLVRLCVCAHAHVCAYVLGVCGVHMRTWCFEMHACVCVCVCVRAHLSE